ncbi:beta-1,3-galactosyltransferase 2 [Sphaeramia orbicularis]|uniref:beta-1,3-galactosyltransferase 2 n=1 Tax=Sphaeramia orbicularis TaxID=375764 RepID=UPI00117DA531|nr:beta-1,3-galactosyltransferase 2-like [Sphaeramia orbicularis]
MRSSCSWRLVKFLAASAVLVLSLQILVYELSTDLPTPVLLSEEDYRVLSPQTYKYILNQPAACKHRTPFLVFMVPVAPQQVEARQAVRKTWGAPGAETLTLFFMGVPEEQGSGVQEQLEAESGRHADIIQMDFVDSYPNLTIKTMMMMNWLATHCPNASYAMKVDSDIFVNIFYLMQRLRGSPRWGYITGSVIRNGKVRRDSSSKWFVSKQMYPKDRYPTYMSGAGYVFSSDLAWRISWASRYVKMIPLEDVYVGLCLQVLDVRPVYSYSLPFMTNLFEVRDLQYDRCTFARRVIVNGFSPSELVRVWQDFYQGHVHC